MRDVLQALTAVHDDQGAWARIVLYAWTSPKGETSLSVRVQACDAEGVPLPDVPSHGCMWPTPNFKTLSAAFLWYVTALYATLEHMRYQSGAEERREG
jgi:hypothetical protein